MKKRILLATDKDQFEKFNYNMDYKTSMDDLGGNSGNSVFQYSLQSMISDENTEITIYKDLFKMVPHDEKYFEEINDRFDCIVYSPANIIAEYAKGRALSVARNVYEKVNIPIHLVGLGAQSNKEYSTDFLDIVGKDVYETFSILLNKGGRIAVRGYFTAECLKRAGFSENDFAVVGCPSLFMKGKNLHVDKKCVSQEEFIPSLNGFRVWNNPESAEIFEKYEKSIFVCQEEFYRLLYLPEELTWKEFQYLSDEKQKWYRMYMEDRIKLYGNFQSWYTDLHKRNISFSYGCRVHGNIVPILVGIPSYIETFDSRVRELAEYFDIPSGSYGDSIPDLYELYQSLDYSRFNANFPAKYEKFAQFMDECGLPHNVANIQKMDAPVISEESKEIIKEQKNKLILRVSDLAKETAGKKIAFVAHEYGLYLDHGGVASYLYQMTKGILQEYPDIEVHVLAGAYDSLCDLISNPKFYLHPIAVRDYSLMGQDVLSVLREVKPDIVEAAEYGALALESMIYKYEVGAELKNTKFFVNNHSATRECYEWSVEVPLETADDALMITSLREKAQMLLAEQNIAPSSFLCKYVSKRYGLQSVVTLRHPTNLDIYSKSQLHQEVNGTIDLSEYENKFVVSCISRFEGRKRQKEIIEAFVNASDETGWDAVLILAGNSSNNLFIGGEYREECFRSVPERYYDRILFFDFANMGLKRQIYSISTVGVMASVYENFPVAMTEYVYSGVPILVSKYNGSADYMADTLDYTVFDPFDSESLKKKMIDFYRLGRRNCDEIAMKQFQTLRFMTNPQRAIYEKIKYFSDYELFEKKCDEREKRKLVFGDLHSAIDCAGIVDIIFTEDSDSLNSVEKLLEIYHVPIARHKPENKIYFFCSLIYTDISDMLCNSNNCIMPKVTIEEKYVGKRWIEFLVSEIIGRKDGMVVIQSADQLKPSKKYAKEVKEIVELFKYMNLKFDMGSLYGEG